MLTFDGSYPTKILTERRSIATSQIPIYNA